ncbi:MAG TPA: hypothetical protein VFZ67_06980, partial [Nitrososphaera sp.]
MSASSDEKVSAAGPSNPASSASPSPPASSSTNPLPGHSSSTNPPPPPPSSPPPQVIPPTPEPETPPAPPRLLAGIFGLPDTLKTLSNLGLAKCKINPAQGILMGWQAMSYLAFAALFAFIIMAAVAPDLSPGFGRFLMWVVF